MNLFKKNKNRSGQVMVESLVALTLAVSTMAGVFALLSNSLSSNVLVADQYIGSNLASEGIELVKNLIDKNIIQGNPVWNSGLAPGRYRVSYDEMQLTAYNPTKIKFDSNTNTYKYTGGTDTKYERYVDISWPNADEIKVISNVSWTGRAGVSLNVSLEDHFFNWRK